MVRLRVIILIGVFQSADEEIKEMLTKENVTTVTTEPADNSGPSTPSSPVTPVDDSELNLKPAENVATSTTVQDPVPDEKIDVATSATESLCTSTTESTQLSKEVNSNSVSECLVEINVSVGSGRNTPSPCPSTAGKCLGNFLHHLFFLRPQKKKNNQRLCFSLSLIISETNKRERERNLAITTYLPRLLELGQIFERTKTYTASPFVYMGPADGSLNVSGKRPTYPSPSQH